MIFLQTNIIIFSLKDFTGHNSFLNVEVSKRIYHKILKALTIEVLKVWTSKSKIEEHLNRK